MQIIQATDAVPYDETSFVAQPLATGTQGNVRIIRLLPGQALPPHRHGASDLFLLAASGTGTMTTAEGDEVELPEGSLAQLTGDEELRIENRGTEGLTLLAFLAPVFPPQG